MQVIMSMEEYEYQQKQVERLKKLREFMRECNIFSDDYDCWLTSKDVVKGLSVEETKELFKLANNEGLLCLT